MELNDGSISKTNQDLAIEIVDGFWMRISAKRNSLLIR